MTPEKIAEVLKKRQPLISDVSARDTWNDLVREFGDALTIGYTDRTKPDVRENFYRLCGANPQEWRI